MPAVGEKLYVGEGMNASVAVTKLANGVRNFHISGKVEASTDTADMRMQRMLGHLPALLHPGPRSVLVVGCGAGVTAGSFAVYPSVERIVVCEIEPLIPRVVAQYFAKQNHDVLKDHRTQVIYDDARHYLLTTREHFDIITSDPTHPWVKGAATLYTKEYFELCKQIGRAHV
jgi:spermidine synthase